MLCDDIHTRVSVGSGKRARKQQDSKWSYFTFSFSVSLKEQLSLFVCLLVLVEEWREERLKERQTRFEDLRL